MARETRAPNLALLIVRGVFLLVAASLGIRLHDSQTFLVYFKGWIPWNVSAAALPWVVLGSILLIAIAAIAFDAFFRRKKLDVISAVYFGLIIGLILTYVMNLAVTPLLPSGAIHQELRDIITGPIMGLIGMVLCYLCISVLLQTKDNFRFIIPYVEFSREVKGNRPTLLDTSVIIDGRIAEVVETGALETRLIMPQFIVNELQNIADSSDKLRRGRGRRGLDILNRLRKNADIDLTVYDHEPPELEGQAVDLKLVLLAKHLDGNIITNDYNLNKVAKLQEVGVVNLNDLANALKPVFLPGEKTRVQVVKPGEEPRQGVGYLDDGTMIVIEGGREHLGKTVDIVVTSVLQTSAGRMVFGRIDEAGKQTSKA